MNHEQTKYLKERIAKANRRKFDATHTASRKPAEVSKAERILKKWNVQERAIVKGRQERLAAAYHLAYQSIMFQESGDAIKALREFERFMP